MKKLLTSLFLFFGLTGAVFATCPANTTKYSRAWFFNNTQAGQYTHAQLWNRGGKNITLDSFTLSTTSASSIVLLVTSSPLPHDLTVAGAGSSAGLAGDGSYSGAGEIRWFVDAEFQGGQLLNLKSDGVNSVGITNLRGMIVPPNRGIVIRLGSSAAGLYSTFTWCE